MIHQLKNDICILLGKSKRGTLTEHLAAQLMIRMYWDETMPFDRALAELQTEGRVSCRDNLVTLRETRDLRRSPDREDPTGPRSDTDADADADDRTDPIPTRSILVGD